MCHVAFSGALERQQGIHQVYAGASFSRPFLIPWEIPRRNRNTRSYITICGKSKFRALRKRGKTAMKSERGKFDYRGLGTIRRANAGCSMKAFLLAVHFVRRADCQPFLLGRRLRSHNLCEIDRRKWGTTATSAATKNNA